jgi:hypothetical protein
VPVLKVDLDPETFDRLTERAARERRPIVWQAEVMLRRACGLPGVIGERIQGSAGCTDRSESES